MRNISPRGRWLGGRGGGVGKVVVDSLQDTHCRKKCAAEPSNLDSG